ncbi:hypothetical protein QBC35DRAFT_187493 [Podospora australis]|uniref:Serine/threonine-protein kinase ppk6 n=1 Tax=Podospora australis TaxID=1536484 RepID=A0AAN6WWP3_9PEZI|nr:hypothetical protein QBC35DRAFT_187493 [Podospora australis]
MSADLFAAFSDAPSTSSPQPNRPTPTTTPAAGDPFSFLSGSSSAPQQPSSQPSIQWPPIQAVPNQTNSFLSAQINEPASSNGWGGDLGSLGGYQTQNTAVPAAQKPPLQLDDDDDEEDEDGWGDFEVASPVNTSQPPPVAANTVPSRTRIIRASTMDLIGNKLLDLGLETSTPSPPPSWGTSTKQAPPKVAHNPDPDVLFDADYEADNVPADDDDFGDFEAVAPPAKQAAPTRPAQDLLSLVDLGEPPAPAPTPVSTKKQPPGLTLSNTALQGGPSQYPQAPKSPYGSSFHDRKPEPVKQLQVKPPTIPRNLQDANQASPSPITAWPTVDEGFGNKWEEFKDIPDTTKPTVKKAPTASKTKSKSKPAPTSTPAATADWEWQDWGDSSTPATATPSQPPAAPIPSTTTSASTEPRGPPPTNIPPPSVLLSLFPQLLDLATISLLKPLLTLSTTSPAYQRVLSSPQTLAFLKGYLALATVAARVIAGRKHRWHRDKFLSQSMSISAAAAGGKSGMKLTGVDKTQSAREDNEAAEVVETWKKQVGRLRTVVAAVNTAHAGENLRVPEVALNMNVSTARNVPTAPKACIVCGLKRDERVSKVDVDVEDSFGEWWVEFWGHRGCSNFWVEHERELRQR